MLRRHDDGSCVFDLVGWDSLGREFPSVRFDESNCGWQPDGNADGLVGVSDLLDLLGVYGDVDADLDGIWDSDLCVDTDACNYDSVPTESCIFGCAGCVWRRM